MLQTKEADSMQLKKKIISLIICAAAALSALSGTVVSAENAAAEITEASVQRAELLRSLGTVYALADGETENLADKVSRAEFAKIIVKYFNKPYTCTYLSEKPYADVELTNEYARDIKAIKDYGFVFDANALKFRPDDFVTVNEAAIMLVRGLGYTFLSDERALASAAEMHILSGAGSGYATLDGIYTMLENTLDAAVAEEEYKNGSFIYKSSADKTMLSENYDTEKMRGTVTANSATGLSAASGAVGKNQIEIDGRVYDCKYKKCGEYLGCAVDFYLNSDDDGKVLYAALRKTNDVTVIDASDIDDADNTKIIYTPDGQKRKTVTLEKNFDVIYNQKAYSGYGKLKNILPKEGSVTAIDRSGNGNADVLIIAAYDYYMVNDVYFADQKIYAADGSVIDMGADKTETEIRNKNGNLANFAAIKKNHVITVMQSKNTDGKKMISVIISDEKITGKVTGIDDDSITVEKKEYPATDELLKNIALGKEGTFYLAHNGKAAFYKAVGDTAWKIGVIYKTYTDERHDNAFSVKLYTPDGEFISYDVDDNARAEKTTQLPGGARGSEKIAPLLAYGDVIRYQLNQKGEIGKIETADAGYLNGGEKVYLNGGGLRTLGEASGSFYYRNGIFDGKTVTDKDTLFFVIPSEKNRSDTDMFYTSEKLVLKSNVYDYTYAYKAYAFGDGDVAYANIVVLPDITVSTDNINTEEHIYVIDRINGGVTVGDDEYNQLIMYGNGEKCVYYCSDETLSEYGLEKHDIIQFEADAAKKIRTVKKIMNGDSGSSAPALLNPGTTNSNGTNPSKDVLYSGLICYGTVREKGSKYIEFTFDGDTKYIGLMERCKYAKTGSGKYDTAVSSFDEVSVGDNFVAVVSSGEFKDMIIIK